jgi:hypothetical protein
MPLRILWIASALLALTACSSEPSPYAPAAENKPPVSEPMKPEAPWHPVPMKDLVFVSRTAETFRPDGDPLKLSARVTAVIANRGDQSGEVALRLGLVLPDGTQIGETRVIELGSHDEETVEAVFDLTQHEDRINGVPKYVHEILTRP